MRATESARTSTDTTEAPQSLAARHSTPAKHMPDRSLAGTRDHDRLPFACRCGARWSGNSTCHCGSCHISLSGVTNFDRHRRNGQCLDPAELGMSLLSGRAYPCWGSTEDAVDTSTEETHP